jgi:arylsulfatase A-like enzyme
MTEISRRSLLGATILAASTGLFAKAGAAIEMQGNAALYKNGWMANSRPTRAPWVFSGPGNLPTDGQWELYNLTEDYSQSRDLAQIYPERLESMQEEFWRQAAAGNVLPLDNRSFARWDSSNRRSARRPNSAISHRIGV